MLGSALLCSAQRVGTALGRRRTVRRAETGLVIGACHSQLGIWLTRTQCREYSKECVRT